MRKPTELMRSILTSKTAQRIIDWISPIYGNSYVGLWIIQAIGAVLDDVGEISDQLRYETNACTADLLLDYWEKQYGIPKDSSLTKEQRRARIISKMQSRGPCNPARLAEVVSAACEGAEAEVIENVSKNKFQVKILDDVRSIIPAVQAVERIKPAHLIFEVIVVPSRFFPKADVKAAAVVTYAETYRLNVGGIFVSNETLYANVADASTEGESVVFAENIAASNSEILIIK